MLLRCLLLACLLLAARPGQAQLVVDDTMTPTQLVQDVLMGVGVSASNVTFNGVPDQGVARLGSGSFVGSGGLGLQAGVILSTGLATSAAGPEDVFNSDDLGNNGNDPDLRLLVGGHITDHSILEFDLVPQGDTLWFRYVFASKEYPDWVCSEFNDAFGFFLSGPGIAGPFSRGAVNIALLPDRVTPVAINNVHAGGGLLCPPTNAMYYVDNIGGQVISHGGYTTVLTASARVRCGETYHIKLAIADAGGVDDEDTDFDSTVFIEAGSFTSTAMTPRLVPGMGVAGDTLFEGCFPMDLSFLRSGDLSASDTFLIAYSGSFTNGEDVVPPLPMEVVFPPGEANARFTFHAPLDEDGPETVVMTITGFLECMGDMVENTFTFVVEDAPELQAVPSNLTVACGDSVELAPSVSGGYGAYIFDWGAMGIGPSITVAPTVATAYEVVVTDTCGTTARTTFQVDLSPPPPLEMQILGLGSVTESCGSEEVRFIRPEGVEGDVHLAVFISGEADAADLVLPAEVIIPSGEPSIALLIAPVEDNVADDGETAIINGSFTDACGRTVSASVTLEIRDAPPILLTTEDHTAPCAADSIPLVAVATGGVGGLTLVWSTGATGPLAYASTMADGQYTVTASDDCGRSISASSRVTVECEVIVPNVFTPNGDGRNDLFAIEGIMNTRNSLRILNRWGQLVFAAVDYRNDWIGFGLADGTYFYEVVVDGHDKPYTGYVTILRD